MKKVIQLAMVAWMLAIGLQSCRPDGAVNPVRGTVPYVQGEGPGDTIHELPDTICGALVSGNLVNSGGDIGSGNIFGADQYGTWALMATPGEMVIQTVLGRGWFASAWYVYMGDEYSVPTDQSGNPNQEAFPQNSIVSPVRNNVEIRFPIVNNMRCPNATVVLCCMRLVELDFLGNAYNDVNVWLDGQVSGNAGARKISFCAEECVLQGPAGLPCITNPILTATCQQIPNIDQPTPNRTYSGGNLTIQNSSDIVAVTGNVNLNTVNFNGEGTLIIEAGAVVSGGINANNGGRLVVRGTFNWNGSANLNRTFSIQIGPNGVINKAGDLTMNSQTNVLNNQGTLNIAQNLSYQGVVFNSGLILANGFNLNSNRADLVNGESGVIQVAQFLNVNNHALLVNCGNIEVGNNLEINSGSWLVNNSRLIVQQVTHNNAIFENHCFFVSGVSGTADGFSHQGTRTLLADGSVLVTRNFYWSPNGPLEIEGNALVMVAQSTFDVNGRIISLDGPSSLRVNGGARLTGNGHLIVSDMNPMQQGDNPQNGTFPSSILSLINVQPQTTLDIVIGNKNYLPF